jgi:hypothetical protein
MKFNENMATIHGYLCGDGYVIKNPPNQKKKYYHIGFRNTNIVLLKDFQERFSSLFNKKPIITSEGRCRIQNKKIYQFLTNKFSYYSYEWTLPKLSTGNLKFWLRAFFDCEGWVENQPRKSRLIGLECCNEKGIVQIQTALKRLGINSQLRKKKGKTIWRLTICGLNNIIKFKERISFLHPSKISKLQEAIDSYKNCTWNIPSEGEKLKEFIISKGKYYSKRKELRFFSIQKENLLNLEKALKDYNYILKMNGPWKSGNGSYYYCLTIKNWEENNETI